MINPMATLFASVKAKMYQMTYGIKKYLNPRYLGRIINVQIRKMTQSLFSIKPKSSEDYYTLGSWAVSKKLAILIIVLINMGCIMLILNLMPARTPAGADTALKLPSYRYTSLRLCGFDGAAQVLSSSGKVVYRGSLEKGMAKGEGTLYDLDGRRVYVGGFDHNMYNGIGTLYYENGSPLYNGGFADNRYSGTGTLYYPNNTPKYEGEFSASQRNGQGKAYSNDGRLIYDGQFIMDKIDYLRFFGLPSGELKCYKGKSRLYEGDYTTSVVYDDFGLVYEMEPQADDPTVNTVIRCYDVGGTIDVAENKPMTALELAKKYKEVVYRGEAPLTTGDYAALELCETKDDAKGRYPFTAETISEGTYRIHPQSSDTIYIETYQSEEYVYTYYFLDKDEVYSFYSVEKVSKKD